ncbi:MAG: hypothetical protein II079_01535, partial [Oscillospiraceae bacterium]|nr:hypothetical protein [Oscillospiraceae bacterium]
MIQTRALPQKLNDTMIKASKGRIKEWYKSGFIEVCKMLELLKARFSEHRERHPNLEWSEVEHRLREDP